MSGEPETYTLSKSTETSSHPKLVTLQGHDPVWLGYCTKDEPDSRIFDKEESTWKYPTIFNTLQLHGEEGEGGKGWS